MNIYDTASLYGLAIKAADNYTAFFRAIAQAVEASRSEKPEVKNPALLELERTCDDFRDTLFHIGCVCSENTKEE